MATGSDRVGKPAVQSSSYIARVFQVLEAVGGSGRPVGPREIARDTNIDRSAVNRILLQLVEINMLVRTDGRYSAAPRAMALGRATASSASLIHLADPILRALTDEFDETVYLCKRLGDFGAMIHSCESRQPVRYVVRLDEEFPLYAGAAGRAILAGVRPAELEKFFARTSLVPLTPYTVTDVTEAKRMVALARASGFATAHSERVPGGFGVAAPFFDHFESCVGSIILTIPEIRLDESRVSEYGRAVTEAAQHLSKQLGYPRRAHGPF